MTLPYRSGLLAIFKFQFIERLIEKKYCQLFYQRAAGRNIEIPWFSLTEI